MDIPSKTIIDVLTFLLPGFITASLVYSLTPVPRPIPFERVVQALIFTMVVQAAVVGVESLLDAAGSHWVVLGSWTDSVRLVWSVVLAVVLGILLVWTINSDKLHRLLRIGSLTFQTSFPSEWFGVFAQNTGYLVLHLKGERRLYGWPEEWPSSPDKGHFVIAQAEWLVGEEERIPLEGVQQILIRAEDVEMVELMKVIPLIPEAPNGRP